MCFSAPRGGLVIACERVSRRLVVQRLGKLTALAVADALAGMLAPLPATLRRSLTFDNGPEFSAHRAIAAELGVETRFCPPHAPWTKGSVESAIGRLRRFLPRRTNIYACNPRDIEAILANYNATPRACLGYKTPDEVFNETVALQP